MEKICRSWRKKYSQIFCGKLTDVPAALWWFFLSCSNTETATTVDIISIKGGASAQIWKNKSLVGMKVMQQKRKIIVENISTIATCQSKDIKLHSTSAIPNSSQTSKNSAAMTNIQPEVT